MAVIQNEIDTILQAAGSRIITAPLPPNVSVPNGQVSGLGALALKNTVTANVMAANSITAGNGAIGDLTVNRLKIAGLTYSYEVIDINGGVLSGRTYHYSGRLVLPYVNLNPPAAFPITGYSITDSTANYFDWVIFSFNSSGSGLSGGFSIAWGYL